MLLLPARQVGFGASLPALQPLTTLCVCMARTRITILKAFEITPQTTIRIPSWGYGDLLPMCGQHQKAKDGAFHLPTRASPFVPTKAVLSGSSEVKPFQYEGKPVERTSGYLSCPPR